MLQPPQPLGDNLLDRWFLRPDVAFLNHGSFGAVPRAVLEAQDAIRRQIEAEPVEMLWRRYAPAIAQVKSDLADFLGATPDALGLVTNATEATNAVLASIPLVPGDQILTTTHVYNAARQAMKHAASRTGATYHEIDLPTPIHHAQQITDRITAALTDRTRLLVIDHVTSPTALVFPVEQVVAACRERGVAVLVDGAHAPGMVPLHLDALGATFYTGNLHKWCCCPRGSAFLWVHPSHRDKIHPLSISHHYGQGLGPEFDWQGTRDKSAWLTIPAALSFLAEFGWDNIRNHNNSLAAWAQQFLAREWSVDPLCPPPLLGSMATLPLPGKLARMTADQGASFQQSLYDQDRVEAPRVDWQGQWHIRVSAQTYNRPEDYQRLAKAILRRL